MSTKKKKKINGGIYCQQHKTKDKWKYIYYEQHKTSEINNNEGCICQKNKITRDVYLLVKKMRDVY